VTGPKPGTSTTFAGGVVSVGVGAGGGAGGGGGGGGALVDDGAVEVATVAVAVG
jgi:hypothetical protein